MFQNWYLLGAENTHAMHTKQDLGSSLGLCYKISDKHPVYFKCESSPLVSTYKTEKDTKLYDHPGVP